MFSSRPCGFRKRVVGTPGVAYRVRWVAAVSCKRCTFWTDSDAVTAGAAPAAVLTGGWRNSTKSRVAVADVTVMLPRTPVRLNEGVADAAGAERVIDVAENCLAVMAMW